MKHHKVLLFLSVLIPQAFCGFVLPRDAPDGLMAWTEEDDGTTTNYTLMTQDSLHPSPLNYQATALLRRGMGMRTRDTDRSTEKEFEVSDLPALPITRAGCGTEDRITEDEFLEVSWKLKAYCHMQQARGHKIARRSIVAMHQGKTWAYMCYWGNSHSKCSAGEVEEAMEELGKSCGPLTAGWLFMEDWDKSYGLEVNGVEICPNLCWEFDHFCHHLDQKKEEKWQGEKRRRRRNLSDTSG